MTKTTLGMEHALHQRSGCIGAFMAPRDEPGTAFAFGSCVAVRHNGQIRLVTAAHTLFTAGEEHPTCLIRFGPKAFLLQAVEFKLDRSLDVGVSTPGSTAEISEYLVRLPDGGSIPDTAEIAPAFALRGAECAAGLIGFPSSKGKVSVHHPSKITLSHIITHEVSTGAASSTTVSYGYNWRQPSGFDPIGMSGGAAFSLVPDAGQDQWRTLLRGILIEHVEGSRIHAAELAYFHHW